ncbi:FlgB family protein [Roseicyclus sp. F158]|uniref:FlgB family protein n=1 Tax=Tropicimonas omnivorans TaxID=3075590 RepID=A0ABU3DDA9_9RHOB|nr:FlgB family protein [Roseicyclus sp. F158]MDT0681693.1 FlgB family protein [Roseicyclus sp. F158]
MNVFKMAHGMAAHAGRRQALIAGNIARVDMPGEVARDIAPFSEVWDATSRSGPSRTRAGHLVTGWSRSPDVIAQKSGADPNGNTISVETEMVKSSETRQQHEMALAIYRNALNVIRHGLGR